MYGNSTIPEPPTDTAQSTTVDTIDRYCTYGFKILPFWGFEYHYDLGEAVSY